MMLQTIKAVNFAANAHRKQRRKNVDSDPYINHCIEVAYLLSEAGIDDPLILQAALLHDVVEDCGVSETDIRENFGETVARLVMECTDDKTLSKVERKKLQITHSETISDSAALIKLADKISNMKELKTNPPVTWSSEIVSGYVMWSRAVYENISGKNSHLDKIATDIFTSHGVHKVDYAVLENYYDKLTN